MKGILLLLPYSATPAPPPHTHKGIFGNQEPGHITKTHHAVNFTQRLIGKKNRIADASEQDARVESRADTWAGFDMVFGACAVN